MFPCVTGKSLVSLLALLWHFTAAYSASNNPRGNSFNWKSVKPSKTLDWIPCYQGFHCAKLEVPLDYSDPSLGTTGIAFVKFTAPNASESSHDVLFTYGGPGGEGVGGLLEDGPIISQFLGDQHNIVSFDQRGVGNSGPAVDCFPNNTAARDSFSKAFYSEVANASSTSLDTQFYSSALFGEWCSKTISGNHSKELYISTPAVAQDLLSYAEADHKLASRNDSKPQLWTYSVSYGTVITTTFASLFPENVGRIILDGLVDAEDYYHNGWVNNLFHSDQAMALFGTLCHQAGPKNCSFWGPSPQNITDRLDHILEEIKFNPIPVTSFDGSASNSTGLATYSDLKYIMLGAIYTPVVAFPGLADVLTSLENGMGFDPALVSGYLGTADINTLIRCVDGYGHNNFSSVQDYGRFVDQLVKQSKYFGEVWPTNADAALCRSLDLSIPNSIKYKGPLPPSANKTANPMLFISNSVDPITPAANGHKALKGFPGSALLIQEAVGHTSINQGGSECMFKHVQAYLDDSATLPPTNASCGMALVPFKDQLTT